MHASASLIAYEDLRSLAFGGISGVYAGVGTPTTHPIKMLKVTNLTDANLLISFNGVDDKDIIAAQSIYIYDYESNRTDSSGQCVQSAQTRVYVKQASGAATSGSVYVTVIYATTAI